MATTSPRVLWQPTATAVQQSRLQHYLTWLRAHRQLDFSTYEEVWYWSVDQPAAFWASLWDYFEVASPTPYQRVLEGAMPGANWFPGSQLNYAEHIFRQATDARPALLFRSERHPLRAVSWQELTQQVASLSHYLRQQGIGAGDRVAAYLPTIPEATVAFLATCALGAVWSSCSPDFGTGSVTDRFQQIEPKVLIAVDGYTYNGKPHDRTHAVRELQAALPSVERVLLIPYLQADATLAGTVPWAEALATPDAPLTFASVPFAHPIWVLYSSGTTGLPKAITHSHGGVLLEHLKYLAFHNDCRPGERFFWYTTTGWMMWNFVQASLLVGATAVLYDGSPAYPTLDTLWQLTEEAGIHHFGTSAGFLMACRQAGLAPGQQSDLATLRSIGSTGSPLPPEGFDWVYEAVKSDVWLTSMSGGTDVCSAFVGGCPLRPVYEGEIQCRALGCALDAYDDQGQPVRDMMGEMVITQPMPSMPIYFWNDPERARYRDSYFEMFPGVWRHGDWIEITSRDSLIIYGRSDATLNRGGVRIGTSEVYRAVDQVPAVADSLVVCLDLPGGQQYMPLFVKMRADQALTDDVIQQLRQALRHNYSPRHVPDAVVAVEDIPYTLSGKKMEAPVKRILMGQAPERAANRDSMRNPESLAFFVRYAQEAHRR
ncbi:acetoacetyl-CoA synthetase [Catalinimonas alkaloidigena]|uniref:Acetoacetyl-CoA synthetase n=1 Tax=Catalinimonas alkaloidigena TaxID=1075417 RepID=A0A1G9RCY4_9BACT|nr:acetoacetate--CoA ligase [Catalinimonas alkaloidigena]SDM20305.1 acetoacetyl-CoA synthetase [Catalinimonas alkaloidigena]